MSGPREVTYRGHRAYIWRGQLWRADALDHIELILAAEHRNKVPS